MIDADIWEPLSPPSGPVWVERECRILTGPRRGPVRLYPHQREPIEALTDPRGPREIGIMGAAQSTGKSTIGRLSVAYWLACSPGPITYAIQDEVSARQVMRRDLVPLIRGTPALARLIPSAKRSLKVDEFTLKNGAALRMAWAGSPGRLTTHPARYKIADEIDRWPAWSGSDADPLALLRARGKAYEPRDKLLLISTPTTPSGRISLFWESTPDRRVYGLPCHSCHEYVAPAWERVCWDGGSPHDHPSSPVERKSLARSLLADPDSVWITCHCGHRFGDTDRLRLMPQGRWVPAEGAEPGAPGASLSRAYHLGDLTTMPLVRTAAGYLSAITPAERMEWTCQSLGLPWADPTGEVPDWLLLRRCTTTLGVVPPWADRVVAAADTQADHWWYVVRAWGPDGRSRGLAWGRVETWDALIDATIGRAWPREDGRAAERVELLGVDARGGDFGGSGQRTSLVYDRIRRTPGTVAILGEERKDAAAADPYRLRVLHDTEALLVSVGLFKDRLAAAVAMEDPVLWEEPDAAAADHEYIAQMTSEVRVVETTPRGERAIWRRKSTHRANHLWDAAVYCCALADSLRDDPARRQTQGDQDREMEMKGGGGWLGGEAWWPETGPETGW